jgi:hypothetical protein
VLAEAQAIVNRSRECWWQAELYRLKAELRLLESTPENPEAQQQAEDFSVQALTIARRQNAKSLELRVATSLCHLWQRRGKRAEAHRMLAEVYGWFKEGSDTRDLVEAKILLEALSS